jgi:hypothetical protein
MAVHLQIRDLPQPTLDEWLDGLNRLKPVSLTTSAAEAVRQAREADDAALGDALGRS